ncbi:hypothetical protein BH23CHL2_BH23CHL2_20430 [soil metagenome]
MIRRRLLPALLLSALLVAGLLGACSPLGDDDDDDANNDTPGTNQPTATTREVVMSTFTPTEVVPPDQKTATAEAEQTAAVATQTARAGLPTPTPEPSADSRDALSPPLARIETPDTLVESYLGSYSWQFSDDAETYADIGAPTIPLNQGDPAQFENGAQISIRYYGDEYRTPPLELEVAVYDFEANSATPLSPQGQATDDPAFTIRTDPVQNLRVDPDDPAFTLQGFAPGHYVLWVQGRWGQHPALERQLFVTWVFDIEIVE